MHKQIYVNLAVDDLARSRAFFERLGFAFNPQFSNDKGACLVLGENLYAMLLVKDFFKTFIGKPLADPSRSTEVIVCLSCESRAEVDALVAKARAAGAAVPRPAQDHGFMYGHGFEDLDGHVWELAHMPGPESKLPALGDRAAIATVAVRDMKKAAAFYEQVLGLTAQSREGEEVISYRTGSTVLNVYRSEFAGSNQATAVAWPVGDAIEALVGSLKAKGVAFEHYDMPGLKREGDLHVGDGMKIAWFKDPDGNIINIFDR